MTADINFNKVVNPCGTSPNLHLSGHLDEMKFIVQTLDVKQSLPVRTTGKSSTFPSLLSVQDVYMKFVPYISLVYHVADSSYGCHISWRPGHNQLCWRCPSTHHTTFTAPFLQCSSYP